MNKLLNKLYTPLIIALLVISIGTFPDTNATDPDRQDQALAFIENVLPVDLSKYNITLINHFTDTGTSIAGVTGQPINRLIDNLRYTLTSDDSVLRVNIKIQNDAVLSCHLYVDKGAIISAEEYINPVDAVKSFLEKYNEYTNLDSTNMITLLDNIDITKNSTMTMGGTKLAVSNINVYGIERTSFMMANTVNGADYTSLQVSFEKNGDFVSLRDDRAIYSIGDTTVNISPDQAIDIAMKYIETYSYDMSDDYNVSGFNITEDQTTTQLVAYPINSTELRPYWNINLYLNQTYPGSVKGFSIYVWANTGELFSCTNIAYGGIDPTDTSVSESTPSLENKASSTSNESNSSSPDMLYVLAITVAVIGLAAGSVLLIKKRKK